MATNNAKSDAKKGQARFMDQPGQWKCTTPASVKKRQDEAYKKFKKMMAKKEGKSNGKRK